VPIFAIINFQFLPYKIYCFENKNRAIKNYSACHLVNIKAESKTIPVMAEMPFTYHLVNIKLRNKLGIFNTLRYRKY
ncbi:TPA: hypothetical protein ACG3KP_004064, partial [Clostridioides difficile]